MISNENKKILKKCKKIKILLTDVDGVLTDGGMYYSSNGDFLKKFNARDGMGVNVLRRHKKTSITSEGPFLSKWRLTLSQAGFFGDPRGRGGF